MFVHDPMMHTSISSLPGIAAFDRYLGDRAGQAKELGIPVIAVFPATDPSLKDAEGSDPLTPITWSAVRLGPLSLHIRT